MKLSLFCTEDLLENMVLNNLTVSFSKHFFKFGLSSGAKYAMAHDSLDRHHIYITVIASLGNCVLEAQLKKKWACIYDNKKRTALTKVQLPRSLAERLIKRLAPIWFHKLTSKSSCAKRQYLSLPSYRFRFRPGYPPPLTLACLDQSHMAADTIFLSWSNNYCI